MIINYDAFSFHIQSETCSVEIPDLDFEVGGGMLGGKFTTLEGKLSSYYLLLLLSARNRNTAVIVWWCNLVLKQAVWRSTENVHCNININSRLLLKSTNFHFHSFYGYCLEVTQVSGSSRWVRFSDKFVLLSVSFSTFASHIYQLLRTPVLSLHNIDHTIIYLL